MKKIGFAFLFLVVAAGLMVGGIKLFVQPEDNVDVKDAKTFLAKKARNEKKLKQNPNNSALQKTVLKDSLVLSTIYLPIRKTYEKDSHVEQRDRYLKIDFPSEASVVQSIQNLWQKYPKKQELDANTLAKVLYVFDKSGAIKLSDYRVGKDNPAIALQAIKLLQAKNNGLSVHLLYAKAYNSILIGDQETGRQTIQELKEQPTLAKTAKERQQLQTIVKKYLRKISDLTNKP